MFASITGLELTGRDSAGGRLAGARWLVLALLLSLAPLLAACGGNSNADNYVERTAEELFAEGEQQMAAGNYEDAAKAFEEVERQHPYSQLAVRGQVLAGYAYYEGQLYEEAIAALRTFIELHPGNPDVPYAHYLIGMSYY